MAAGAGIGNIQFLGQLGVGNRQAVIVPSVALHIHGHWHVATNTKITVIRGEVMGMLDGVNNRCVGERSDVASHAQIVAGKKHLRGMGIMTIQACHAPLVHLAAHKRSELVILTVNLSIGIPVLAVAGNL